MHTPPLTILFVHPSNLNFLAFILAPCLKHSPPFCTNFVHPSAIFSGVFLGCFVWAVSSTASSCSSRSRFCVFRSGVLPGEVVADEAMTVVAASTLVSMLVDD